MTAWKPTLKALLALQPLVAWTSLLTARLDLALWWWAGLGVLSGATTVWLAAQLERLADAERRLDLIRRLVPEAKEAANQLRADVERVRADVERARRSPFAPSASATARASRAIEVIEAGSPPYHGGAR